MTRSGKAADKVVSANGTRHNGGTGTCPPASTSGAKAAAVAPRAARRPPSWRQGGDHGY